MQLSPICYATVHANVYCRILNTLIDAARGLNAVELIRNHGPRVHFSLLDVADPASIADFVAWFKDRFGQLDILVNNAAISFNGIHENTVKHAEVVLKTNFYGPKLLIEALLPVFRCSTSKSRILNLSSRLGLTNKVRNPKIRTILEDEENLTAERIEGVLNLFTEHVNNGRWESEGWPETWTEYAVSKLALNAYSRLLAKRLKDCNISVNQVYTDSRRPE
ncbi:hypothetical protein Nepgr_020055 [Nepenthes gracilis]|uniref:Uncharacterized protein n=1 Tax=Nepenthes gracilis TaxID=150966 RepID=A0AAD3SWY2_NEPGR|nr:hypothetical protein Nepgr_020055 [Nepenthes gracilis]